MAGKLQLRLRKNLYCTFVFDILKLVLSVFFLLLPRVLDDCRSSYRREPDDLASNTNFHPIILPP